MKNYSVSFDSMLIFKFKLPYGSLLGVSHWRLLPALGLDGVGGGLACFEDTGPPSPEIGVSRNWTFNHTGKGLVSCLPCPEVCLAFWRVEPGRH